MLLVCPIGNKRLPVEPAGSSDSMLRLTCIHCSRPLLLDRYAGELSPDKIKPESGNIYGARPAIGLSSTEPIIHQRMSTGRDTLAAFFVIVFAIAIVTGGMTLALGTQSAAVAWPKLSMNQVWENVEVTVPRFTVGRASSLGGKKRGHLLHGKTLVQQESYAKGLSALDKAIKADPYNYEAHFWRGWALVKTGRIDEAIAAFEVTIKVNPRYSYHYDNLGWIYMRRGAYDIGLENLSRSLSLRPENGWAYYNRGRIHFQLGQREKALQDTDAACRQGFGKACQILNRYRRETQS